MNSVNEIKIAYHKDYESVLATYIKDLLHKFALMETPFEPITKITGDYSRNILKRAAVNVLFKNYGKQARKRSFWVLRNPSKTVQQLAVMVKNEEIELRKNIWMLNGWGKPCRSLAVEFSMDGLTKVQFVEKHLPHLISVMKCELAMEEKLRHIIKGVYTLGEKCHDKGYSAGWQNGLIRETKRQEIMHADNQRIKNAAMMQIYHKLTDELATLKKIIDSQ